MIEYLIIGLLAVLSSIIIPNKKYGLQMAFVLLTTFLSIRYMWGNDYPDYLRWYQEFNAGDFGIFDISRSSEIMRHGEYGWVIINRMAGFCGIGFFGFIIITTLFECWILYRMIEKYVNPNYYWVALLIWVFNVNSFCVNASMMRQYLCMCMYLLVIDLMIEKKKKGYLLWSILILLISIPIHRSSIFLFLSLPIFYIPVKKNRKSIKWFVLLGLLFILWSFYGRHLLEPYMLSMMEESDVYSQFMGYVGKENTGSLSTGFGVIFRYLLFGAWLLLLPNLDRRHQPIAILLVSSYFFEVIAEIAPIAGRLGLYFSFLSMICWAWLFERAKKENYYYVLFAIEIVVLIRTIPQFFNSITWAQGFMNYQTIFSAPFWM